MEFNTLQDIVMQYYEGGGFVALKGLEEIKDPLHAATGLDEEGQPCFTVILPQ